MRLRALTLLASVVCSLLATPAFSQKAGSFDPFVGSWREDESKRNLAGAVPLIFRQGSPNIEEVRGGEVSPLMQQVVFDGKPHVVDGPASIAWRQIDANNFERKLTENGKLVNTRTITLAADGKTLTEKVDETRTDGRVKTTTTTYQRIEGDKGLVGRWKMTAQRSNIPADLHIERVGDTIKWVGGLGRGFTAALDGKPVPQTGPGVITNTMMAVRLIADRKLEMVTSRNGKETVHAQVEVSADGKTLTQTSRSLTANAQPAVTVYVKQ